MTDAITAARLAFPTGLAQPGGYRFGTDSLLLAAYARPMDPATRLLDLGCGCGVVALSAMLANPGLIATGLDRDESFLAAARENCHRLGLSMELLCLDLETDDRAVIPARSFDAVLANPPFFSRERGRVPLDPTRSAARFAGPGSLAAFCQAGARALSPKGRFFMVYPASGLAAMLRAVEEAKLAPRFLVPVHGRAEEGASRLLLMADRSGGCLCMEPPLILHQGQGRGTRFTDAAARFCPHCIKPNGGDNGY